MEHNLDLATVRMFAVALLIGALIGIEREKRKMDDNDVDAWGLRPFILASLVGAISGWVGRAYDFPWVVVGVLVVLAALIVTSYVLVARVQPKALSLSTELGAVSVFLLGAIVTMGHEGLAIGLGVVTAAVLAYKQPLHGMVSKIGWDDVFAGLRLMIATFVVLPLLPNRAIDPWGALNPYSLWLLVLLISSLGLVGYVATRWLGTGRGAALTALTGGLVSSTAVTLSFARRSSEQGSERLGGMLAGGVLLAWCIMFGRVVVEVLVVNPALVAKVLVPFVAMAVAGGVVAGVLFWRAAVMHSSAGQRSEDVPLKNPFSLTAAAKFGAFFAVVLLVVKLVQAHFPGEGVYLVAALAGLTDVDAITLSMAEYAKTGDAEIAVNAIVIAAITNTCVKCGMVLMMGGRMMKGPVIAGTVVVFLAGAAAVVLV
ncbi:MAG: MgtC/SapB family protein [Betaproteobacteria bacterium]|nr:MgtC/SapB family protein [Betaproteobacteria bacterium]